MEIAVLLALAIVAAGGAEDCLFNEKETLYISSYTVTENRCVIDKANTYDYSYITTSCNHLIKCYNLIVAMHGKGVSQLHAP